MAAYQLVRWNGFWVRPSQAMNWALPLTQTLAAGDLARAMAGVASLWTAVECRLESVYPEPLNYNTVNRRFSRVCVLLPRASVRTH